MSKLILGEIIAFSFLLGQVISQTNKVICYYHTGLADSFPPEDINVDICTHINYAFLGLNEDGSLRLNGGDGLLTRVSALKQRNPNLKVLLSVGGWDEGSVIFSNIAANPDKKAMMASSTIDFLNRYNCDGIDVDWEYPAQNGGIPSDKENFVDMLRVLKERLSGNGFLVTTAVNPFADDASYNVEGIAQQVDFINVMTYDYHQGMDKTGENAPLYPSSMDSEWERNNANVDASINRWLNLGARPEKTVLGLAFYGHTFQLADPGNHGLGAPILGPGTGGGSLAYSAICALDWTEVWDDEQQVPYKYSGDQWVGYDNPQSIREKVRYAKRYGLTGVMMWSVVHDDKNGVCGPRFPLLQEIQNTLNE